MDKIKTVRIRGYRSIRAADLDLHSLNVLIGANGAGKSNLISFFKMMNELVAGRLQHHIAATGRATANLHFGPRVSPQLEAGLVIGGENGTCAYDVRLDYAAGDSLVFGPENLSIQPAGVADRRVETLGGGHRESLIGGRASEGEPVAGRLRRLLDRCQVFHFHDTSHVARLRQFCYVGDDRRLLPDAGNLAAVLYRLRSGSEPAYRRIVATIRQVAPFFDDFDLEPTGAAGKDIILNWRHRGTDLVFGPHQLSDGTLRAFCLVALLMQPAEELPALVVVDEPELGLHPYALEVVASLLQAASCNTQVLISTQSSALVDHFDAGDVIVVEHDAGSSRFDRPNAERLREWLEEYSLGEIWEKNVIGGGPH